MYRPRTLQFALSVICALIVNCTGSREGEPCMTKEGFSGTCQYLTNCDVAARDLKNRKFPKICGANGLQMIVCCPDTPAALVLKGTEPACKEVLDKGLNNLTFAEKKPGSSRIPGEISLKQCRKYAQYAIKREPEPALMFRKKRKYVKDFVCTIDINPLISKGRQAKMNEFPHMAMIGYESNTSPKEILWNCGGSLISEYFILTAGHCLEDHTYGKAKKVRLGVTNSSDTNHAQTVDVEEIIYHPLYIREKYHDIGLLRLKHKPKLSPYVKPACLHTKFDIPAALIIASGWGQKEEDGDRSENLMKVDLQLSNNEQCSDSYKGYRLGSYSSLACGIIDELMICAGSTIDPERDTCPGDSGGPLQIIHDSNDGIKCMYDIVGITSFGKSCGGNSERNPGVYSRVSSYIKWIEDTVWPPGKE